MRIAEKHLSKCWHFK